MRCPFCASIDNKVIDSRISPTGDITRRRRECIKCEGRFTTYERVEISLPMIIKKDGRREPFNREKVFSGIQKACQKRPVTTAQIEKIVNEIERRLTNLTVKEIPARTVGQLIMTALHTLDKVAYIRFASVYRDFRDVEDFVADLKDWPQSSEPDGHHELKFDFAHDPAEKITTKSPQEPTQ